MSAKERKALGRGFGALLKTVDEYHSPGSVDSVSQILISDIELNPKQPRHYINKEKLEELAQSIRMKGIIHPILVRPKENSDKKYELVAGERRLKASKLAGFDKIPALVKPIKDRELLEIALIENIQRDNLNPIEESKAYRDLLEEHGYTQENLAKRVGKNRSTIANIIRLLQLPEAIQDDLSSEKLTSGHARALLAIEDVEKQLELRDKIVTDNMSVRETEEAIRNEKKSAPPSPKKEKEIISPQMSMNQDRLRDIFATKVIIKPKGDKGKIEFEYYNQDDFNRLYALLLKM